jgi:hypothetical protein
VTGFQRIWGVDAYVPTGNLVVLGSGCGREPSPRATLGFHADGDLGRSDLGHSELRHSGCRGLLPYFSRFRPASDRSAGRHNVGGTSSRDRSAHDCSSAL